MRFIHRCVYLNFIGSSLSLFVLFFFFLITFVADIEQINETQNCVFLNSFFLLMRSIRSERFIRYEAKRPLTIANYFAPLAKITNVEDGSRYATNRCKICPYYYCIAFWKYTQISVPAIQNSTVHSTCIVNLNNTVTKMSWLTVLHKGGAIHREYFWRQYLEAHLCQVTHVCKVAAQKA
jgi:hypothetical protein